jgi:hypothetical protein
MVNLKFYDDSRPLKLSKSVQPSLLVTPSPKLGLYLIPKITPTN